MNTKLMTFQTFQTFIEEKREPSLKNSSSNSKSTECACQQSVYHHFKNIYSQTRVCTPVCVSMDVINVSKIDAL